MSTTFHQIVDEVSGELHGMTSDLEQATFLTQDVAPSDLTIQVDDASQVSLGLIEIDDELLWITSTDTTNNVVNIAPFGRGYRGSGAAAHLANAQVTDNPRFPRTSIKQKVQQALSEMYPEVFAVKTDESNTASPVVTAYPVPADCDTILRLTYRTVGPSGLWEPIRRYNLNTSADPTQFATGRSIDIGDPLMPGRVIRVVYATRPTGLINDTDTLDSIGLDDNARDVIIYGACYRLTAGLEIARLQTSTVEQSDRGTFVPAGSATAGSKWYLAVFQERLQNERQRLLLIYPTVTHMSR